LDIPVAAILNSDSEYFEFINYPIIGNNKSFESLYLYVTVIKNAFLKGQQKERLKILRIL
jgi:ribosomal protein S2